MSPKQKVVLTGFVAGLGFVILCGLGVWQLQRLAWKEDLIAMVSERSRQAAVPFPDEAGWAAVTFEADEYRKVALTGRYRHDQEVRVFTSLKDDRFDLEGPGYWVLTPLERADGTTVIVNRGFVPDRNRDPATRPEGQVDGEVTVTGLIRMPEPGSMFTPDADLETGTWYVRDPEAIAAAQGLDRVPPFFVDADATPNPGGLPLGGTTRIAFRNDHLGYAITWFGLALSLAGVFAAWAVTQLRRGRDLADGAPRQ